MSKKQDAMYFDNFIACAGCASQAAQLLKEIFRNFDPAQMPAWMEQIHTIEHTADKKRHAMTDQLAHAFITPIEREDISALSARIDTLTDKLEEVCIRVYMHNGLPAAGGVCRFQALQKAQGGHHPHQLPGRGV